MDPASKRNRSLAWVIFCSWQELDDMPVGRCRLMVALRGAKDATDEDEVLGPGAELIQEMR